MYLIGIDGGGTKTESMVADLEGNVVATAITGSASPRNVGVEKAMSNIGKGVREAFSCVKQEKIALIFVGIPSFAEEYGEKEEEIKEALYEEIKNLPLEKSRIVIGSDQETAFSSGTDEEDGVVAIAGTGSVVRGWNKGRDVKTGGWGWLADKSGAFQIGQEVYQKTVEALDGRSERTLLTDLVLKEMKVDNIKDLNKIVYGKNPIEVLAPLSILANEGSEKGDEIAKDILVEASGELAHSVKNTVKKLEFEEEFPLVLIGGMFKSDIFLKTFVEEGLRFFPSARIILPEDKPAWGAIKLAIRNYEKMK